MIGLSILIRDLKTATGGSHELDQRIVDVIHPGNYAFGPASQYSTSLDAKFPGEEILRVERLVERQNVRWRAWLTNEWSADGKTEILARRLAYLTYKEFEEQNGGPHGREPVVEATVTQEPAVAETGRPEKGPDSSAANGGGSRAVNGTYSDKIIIEALCQHIRSLKSAKADGEHSLPLFPDTEAGPPAIKIIEDMKSPLAVTQEGKNSSATFSEALESWKIHAKPRIKNMERFLRTARRFTDLYGDRPLNSYKKSEVRDFLSQIQKLPKFPPTSLNGKSVLLLLDHVEQHPHLERVTQRTVAAYLKDLSMIFNWAMAADMCAQNPTAGLRVIDRRVQSELRIPYDIDDLKTFFEQAPLFTGCRAPHQRWLAGEFIVKDSLFWFPLFGLFSGARLGEIASATVDDFKSEQGIHFLDIHAGGDNRHLKSQSADRRIPVHPELIKMGFLEYLERQRRIGMGRVFERVEARPDIRTASGWSQHWRCFQRDLGVMDRRKVFHSFRHSFKSACRDAGIEEEVHDAITGHRPYMSGRRYGWRISLTVLAGAMEKVRYPGLDLSNLHV